MSKVIWIGATVVSAIAMIVGLFALGIVDIGDIPNPFPGLPKCTLGNVYYSPDFIEQYGLDLDDSTDSCDCSDTAEWVPESSNGYFCIPIDNMRPDCTTGYPKLDLISCNCISPNTWTLNEGDPVTFTCSD